MGLFQSFKQRQKLAKPRIGLAIAGGGCKAFFALGAGEVLRRAGIKISALSGTSAGTAMGLTLLSGQADDVVDYFCDLTSRNPSNIHLDKLIKGKRPFPHERMYRQTVTDHLTDDFLGSIDIPLAFNALRIPEDVYPEDQQLKKTRMMYRILNAYRKEFRNAKIDRYIPYLPQAAEDLKLEEVVFTEKDLQNTDKAEAIILATSSAPPFVELQKIDGVTYIDGGVYDNLPIRLLPDNLDMVIAMYYEVMDRRFIRTMKRDAGKNVVWLFPDKQLPITLWDYANPAGVRETYELGKEAGENYLRLLETFI